MASSFNNSGIFGFISVSVNALSFLNNIVYTFCFENTWYADWRELEVENIEGYNTTKCCIPLSWSCSVVKGTHKFKSTRNCSESKVKYVRKRFAKSGLEFSTVHSIHSAARTVTPEAITLSLHPTECSYSRWFTVLLKYIVLILS